MNSRQLKMIFAVLAVLVLAYGAVRLLSGDGRRPGGDDIVAAVRDGFSLVRALGPGAEDSVRLEEVDGRWSVNGYPADTSLIRQLTAGLDTAHVGRLVARSATTHARLGIADDVAWRIEIGPAGDPDITFLLGGGGTDGRYARFPPSDEVFAVPITSVYLLGRPVEEWRHRRLGRTLVCRRCARRHRHNGSAPAGNRDLDRHGLPFGLRRFRGRLRQSRCTSRNVRLRRTGRGARTVSASSHSP